MTMMSKRMQKPLCTTSKSYNVQIAEVVVYHPAQRKSIACIYQLTAGFCPNFHQLQLLLL